MALVVKKSELVKETLLAGFEEPQNTTEVTRIVNIK
jgi:hypothetical protein